MEKVYPQFDQALALGHYVEDVIDHEFNYQGIPIIRTQGKNDFDFILPDGKTLEWKVDVRSQCTGCGAIEWPTLQRRADYYGYTLTYARIYTYRELEQLYLGGKIPGGGIGDLGYSGRYIRNMGKHGIPLYQFINDLKNQRDN